MVMTAEISVFDFQKHLKKAARRRQISVAELNELVTGLAQLSERQPQDIKDLCEPFLKILWLAMISHFDNPPYQPGLAETLQQLGQTVINSLNEEIKDKHDPSALELIIGFIRGDIAILTAKLA